MALPNPREIGPIKQAKNDRPSYIAVVAYLTNVTDGHLTSDGGHCHSKRRCMNNSKYCFYQTPYHSIWA